MAPSRGAAIAPSEPAPAPRRSAPHRDRRTSGGSSSRTRSSSSRTGSRRTGGSAQSGGGYSSGGNSSSGGDGRKRPSRSRRRSFRFSLGSLIASVAGLSLGAVFLIHLFGLTASRSAGGASPRPATNHPAVESEIEFSADAAVRDDEDYELAAAAALAARRAARRSEKQRLSAADQEAERRTELGWQARRQWAAEGHGEAAGGMQGDGRIGSKPVAAGGELHWGGEAAGAAAAGGGRAAELALHTAPENWDGLGAGGLAEAGATGGIPAQAGAEEGEESEEGEDTHGLPQVGRLEWLGGSVTALEAAQGTGGGVGEAGEGAHGAEAGAVAGQGVLGSLLSAARGIAAGDVRGDGAASSQGGVGQPSGGVREGKEAGAAGGAEEEVGVVPSVVGSVSDSTGASDGDPSGVEPSASGGRVDSSVGDASVTEGQGGAPLRQNAPVLLRDPAQCTLGGGGGGSGDGLAKRGGGSESGVGDSRDGDSGGDIGVGSRRLDVTLITQASSDRLWMLPYICDRWAGPMVVAALLPPAPPALQPPDAPRASLPWPSSLGLNGSAPRCIASLLELTPPHNTSHPPGAYPINWLRNQAISCARTSHYLIADIDFWPSFELLPLLRRQLPPWGDKQKALVIPAFQRSGHGCRAKSESACREALVKAEMKVPGNFAELSACAKERLCSAFDSEYNSAGQASTNVNAWRGLTAGAKMPIRYEPFVVLKHADETPRFDERFYGYGKNKVQLIVHLRLAGFAFEVLGKGFLVHFPHPVSSSKQAWLHSSAHAAMDRLFRDFEDEMEARYEGVKPATPLCH